MNKSRLEAFSDGVLAIIITIMVLELKVPHEVSLQALLPLLPVFISYLLSFIYIGIYWANHHHLLQTVKKVNSSIIWGNMHLLFWLSLMPFVTAWMGENYRECLPVVFYSIVLILCAFSYFILQKVIARDHVNDEKMNAAMQKQSRKGTISLLCYISAFALAFFQPALSQMLFVVVAVMWVIPDKNIERVLSEKD